MMEAVRALQVLSQGPVPDADLPGCLGLQRDQVERALHELRFEGCRILEGPMGIQVDPSGAYGPAVLSWRVGRPVEYWALTRSTNTRACDLACGGAPSGTVVVTDTQSGGRGRLGRSWSSPPGLNLYFSVVFRPRSPVEAVPRLNLAAGVAVARALGVLVKWPNDVVSPDGRKVAGLLSEMGSPESGGHWLVVGVGVNVNQEAFDESLPFATSLRLHTGRLHDRALLLAELVGALEADLAAMEADPESMLQAWRNRSATLGRPVRVLLGHPASSPSERALVEGVAEDVRPDGALLVRRSDGRLVPVLAGDVEMIQRR